MRRNTRRNYLYWWRYYMHVIGIIWLRRLKMMRGNTERSSEKYLRLREVNGMREYFGSMELPQIIVVYL